MNALIWIVFFTSISNDLFVEGAAKKSPKIIIVGAGASAIAAAAKLLENGYNDIVLLEAQNRTGGRIHSTPLGKGYVDLGAQWCQGEDGNVVYELAKDTFEFGDDSLRYENYACYASDGLLVDHKKCDRLMNLSVAIVTDYESMQNFSQSLGEFVIKNYRNGLKDKEFVDVEGELADQVLYFTETETNSLYASESWFDISSQLNALIGSDGNDLWTWKEHGSKMILDLLTKKFPDPSQTLPVDEKIRFNKEVTNIDWTTNGVDVLCTDGSKYRADHVIVTVSLGCLKKTHLTLFTPSLPAKKINAIDNVGFGGVGKIFLEFAKPFWPSEKYWGAYNFLWKESDKNQLVGTEREWLTEVNGFYAQDAQPNVLGAYVAGKNVKQFESITDEQLIVDCMWLLEKFLGKSLPHPVNMRRSRWLKNKYFCGSYSYASMATQAHNVVMGADLGETLYDDEDKPIVLFAGEATDENNSGYVHGAVNSGWRVAEEIIDYYA